MARVCTEIYPAGFSFNRHDGFYMDDFLKSQLDILIKNAINDWDFTIIITGRGEVRVGKSVLALQIAAYWTDQIKKIHGKDVIFDINNIVFDGRKLIEQGNALGKAHPMSCLMYDEAGADLSGTKIMSQMTQDVLDFYRECGQYNFLNILVLPDFFDLPKPIAITRSKFLIDVDYSVDENGIFQRGFARFYSAPKKKKLFIQGKKLQDYNAVAYDFPLRFYKFYPIDINAYKQLKVEALRNRERRRQSYMVDQRDFAWFLLVEQFGMTMPDLARKTADMTGKFVEKQVIHAAIKRFH